MKLQNLMIIFIIIIIPIVLVFSFYLNLQTKTITLQTDYDTKLIEATKEAIEAFEINTVEWNSQYSTLANSKRQDIMSSINVFSSSLANKLGISGTSKENILSYVPAIVYTMYDGYYIYSPTHVPQTITDDNGVQLFYYVDAGSENAKITTSATQNIKGINVAGEPMYKGTGLTGTYNSSTISFTTDIDSAQKTYKHVLKTFVPYTTTYKNHVINYTLDNYIRVYCEDGEAKEGYIIDTVSMTYNGNNRRTLYYDNKYITPETLSENIAVKNNSGEIEVKEYMYIYNSNNDKRYYDDTEEKFFIVNKNYNKVYLPDVDAGNSLAEYKKLLVKKDNNSYEEIYQLLNKNDNNNWYSIDSDGKYQLLYQYTQNHYYTSVATGEEIRIIINKYEDTSSINYYVENYYFSKWLKGNFSENEIDEILNNKTQNIIRNINQNLNLSISNYSANSKVDYKMPELTDEEWEQALSNISIIAFFQGTKVGLKTYNNYAIATSAENNEYISSESLYFLDIDPENVDNKYYHRYGCSAIENISKEYKNTEFKIQSYTDDSKNVYYYYKHKNGDIASMPCFDCIINRNNIDFDETHYKIACYAGLARERYIQMQRTKLIK